MNFPTFSKPAAWPQPVMVSMKKSLQPTRNSPVFTTGQVSAAVTTASMGRLPRKER